MYRSRFDSGLNELTLDYVSSISDDAEIALYDILGSQAHTIMLHEVQLLSKGEVRKILKALEELKKEKFDKKSDSEDIHELIETLVIKKTNLAIGGKMHTARSRNDQVSLDIRMKIRDDINVLCNCLLDIIESLVVTAKRYQKTIMPLYTHLQQAQVGTFSHYLLAHADALSRDLDRLYLTYDHVNQSPLGAGPIGGTSLPIDRQRTAKLLGFSKLVENSIDATSTRDFIAEYIAALAILMTNLSRISEDFIIWSTSEFSFIELSDEFTSPSSVMPQKKNPDILELTRGKTATIIGNLMATLTTVKGLSTGYGRDLQENKSYVWKSSKTTITALIIIKSMLLSISVNEKNMKKAITTGGYLIALDIAEKLVKQGMPFRKTHKIVGQLVQTAYTLKKNLSNLSESEIKQSLKQIDADPKIVFKIVSSTNAVSSLKERTSQGSAGFLEQKRMIEDRVKKIETYRAKVTKRDDHTKNSLKELNTIVNQLIK
jgi:argininosuccinate lyase